MMIEFSDLGNELRLIKLTGRLDHVGAGEIEGRFAEYCAVNNGRVLVDLSAVEFLTSFGIRLLVLNAKDVASRGGRMFLLSPKPGVRHVVEVSGVRTIIPIYESIDAARAAFLAA